MKISNEFGVVEFDWKLDLNDEEGAEYLPPYYDTKVLELKMIRSAGRGCGFHLMSLFLQDAKRIGARLIFLDCSPLYIDLPEVEAMKMLHKFYSEFGFTSKTHNGYSRMWLVLSKPEDTSQLFERGYRNDNDLHPVLKLIA